MPLSVSFKAMGGPCSLVVDEVSSPEVQALMSQGVQEVQRIEQKFSRYRADSVIGRINAAAGRHAVECDEETAALLNFAQRLHADTGGLFDITSGVLRQAWDFSSGRLPGDAELQPLLALVGWDKVHWDGHGLYLPEKGMEIDLGGLGKEYAADRVAQWLGSQGLRHGFVNLGGDIRVWGGRQDGRAWHVGVQHPRHADRILLSAGLQQGGMATSGDYERFMEVDGQRYCHILDPGTGWPVQAWQSITVVAPTCLLAGVMSTTFMLMQSDAPKAIQESGMRVWAVDSAGQVHAFGPQAPASA